MSSSVFLFIMQLGGAVLIRGIKCAMLIYMLCRFSYPCFYIWRVLDPFLHLSPWLGVHHELKDDGQDDADSHDKTSKELQWTVVHALTDIQ